MQIYGIDFTSAPSRRKPITCARGTLEGDRLMMNGLDYFTDFAAFEAFLTQPGPWVAAMDFPFSLPQQWLQAMGWPLEWEQYVAHIAAMRLAKFADCVKTYRTRQKPGEKYHLRPVDKLAQACSPMMMDYIPVGRMFYQGAPRLLKSEVSVLPFLRRNPEKLVVEGYPALIARRFCGRQGYKSDDLKKQGCEKKHQARLQIIRGITSARLQQSFGIQVQLSGIPMNELDIQNGDKLDAVLCAIQAAWSWRQSICNFGIPNTADAQEGWIVDPSLFNQSAIQRPVENQL